MKINREQLQAMRNSAIDAVKAETKRIIVCAGAGCVSKGALKIYDKFADIMKEKGIKFSLELQKEPHSDSVRLKQSGCHGFCEIGPLVRIEPQGWLYVKVAVEDCEEIIEKTIVNGECVDRLAYTEDGKVYKLKSGELILHAPMEFHSIKCEKEIPTNVLIFSLHINGELPKNLSKGVFYLTPDEQNEFKNIFNLIYDFYKKNGFKKIGDLVVLVK